MNRVEEVEPDQSFADGLMQMLHEMYLAPEIERRRAAGRLPEGFVGVRAVQVILNRGQLPDVRIDDEVLVKVNFKPKPGRRITVGAPAVWSDIEKIEGLELTDADPNAGHFTAILLPDGWTLSWHFQYDRERAADHVGAAREFLDTASSALRGHRLRAFVDNLFSAVELMAKALLISAVPSENTRGWKTHKTVKGVLNRRTTRDADAARFAALYNRLEKHRSTARYIEGAMTLSDADTDDMLTVAEEMYERVSRAQEDPLVDVPGAV